MFSNFKLISFNSLNLSILFFKQLIDEIITLLIIFDKIQDFTKTQQNRAFSYSSCRFGTYVLKICVNPICNGKQASYGGGQNKSENLFINTCCLCCVCLQ